MLKQRAAPFGQKFFFVNKETEPNSNVGEITLLLQTAQKIVRAWVILKARETLRVVNKLV